MIKFWIPKVYSWEDVKEQILKDMEREGILLDGISAGSAAAELSVTMFPATKQGLAGTAADASVPFEKATREAGY